MRAGRRAADRIGKFASGEVITQHAQVLLRRTASRAASRAPLFAPTLSKMPCYRPRRQHTRVSAGNASS
jgi:hypothetical protein